MKKNFTKRIILLALVTIGFYAGAKAQNDDQSAYDDQYAQQYNQPQQQYVQPQQQYVQPAAPQYGDQGSHYYPDANVYYDNSCNRYIYNNGGGWITVNVLPAGISLYGAPCFRVYHRGPQVWLDNAIHIRNFYRGGGYRAPVVYNGGYRNFNRGGWNGGDRVAFNRGGFNRGFGGGRGFSGGNNGGGRHAEYRR